MIKSLKLYFLNFFVINALVYLPHYIYDVPAEVDFSMEGLPSSNKMFA